MIDHLSVRDGMETALAAYLADELSLPVGSGRRGYWQSAPQQTDLQPPADTTAITNYVSGAAALTTALAGVGVIEDPAQGEALRATAPRTSHHQQGWQPVALGWICTACF